MKLLKKLRLCKGVGTYSTYLVTRSVLNQKISVGKFLLFPPGFVARILQCFVYDVFKLIFTFFLIYVLEMTCRKYCKGFKSAFIKV